jgi:hypothetical protein
VANKDLENHYKEALAGNHSVAKVKDVAKEISSEEHLKALLNLIDAKHRYPTPEAAAWCIRHACLDLNHHHTFVAENLISKVKLIDRDSLIKNILGTYRVISIPTSVHGLLADYCLDFLTQPTRSKAVLYYSMEIMMRLCQEVPELTREFIMITDDLLPLASGPFKRKYLKNKKKLK